jgi:hypothetical protein
LAAKRAREIEAAFRGKVGTRRASKMAASGIRKKFVPAKSWFTRAGESANQIKKITKAIYHHRAPEITGVKGPADEESRCLERVRVSTPLLRTAARIDATALARAAEIVSLMMPSWPGDLCGCTPPKCDSGAHVDPIRMRQQAEILRKRCANKN